MKLQLSHGPEDLRGGSAHAQAYQDSKRFSDVHNYDAIHNGDASSHPHGRCLFF